MTSLRIVLALVAIALVPACSTSSADSVRSAEPTFQKGVTK